MDAVLERGNELGTLTGVLEGVNVTGGRVVLVRGEAGIGKTTLLRRFVAGVNDAAYVLEGACDDLLTPQPLGPFWDVARGEDSVAGPLGTGDRRGVMESLLELLARPSRPTVLVLEDTQWADEATLDVVTFLGRRIARTRGLLVLSYRDGEVDAEHPLRQVIGGLPAQVLVRMPLVRLTRDAVAAMIGDQPFDAAEVVALTAGNPLFVREVLASGVEGVPSSVRDAVVARAARLSPPARRMLDLVSVIPGGVDRRLVDDLLAGGTVSLPECVSLGLLHSDGDHIGFPHELQRRAIEAELAPDLRRQLNATVLAGIVGREEPARLAHHAREAADAGAVIRYAPEAARAAMTSKSHREAVAHFRTLEPHLDAIGPADLADILTDWARVESYLDLAGALDLTARAVAVRRSVGDELALARLLTFAVRVNEVNGYPERADSCAEEAVRILEPGPRGPELAAALGQMAWLRLMRGDDDRRGVEIADRAIAIAEAAGDGLTVARSLVLKGSIEHGADERLGFSLVEEGHRRAVEGGHRFEEVNALINLAGLCGDARDIARAGDLVRRARDAAARYELPSVESYARAVYAEILLWQGDWTQAEDVAGSVLGADPHAEAIAWRVLGSLQSRRGQTEARAALERAWSHAEASGELQQLDPAAATLAEHLWLTDDRDPAVIADLQAVADRGRRSGPSWPSGALTFWLWKLGLVPVVPPGVVSFYGRIMDGDAPGAAHFWERRGAPYEQALALMHSDVPARIRALHLFDDLGARAAAHRVRSDLVDEGVRVPRGRSRAARDHGAGLTARQAEVLELLGEGLANVDIADRLFLSHRTVENHVAAILMRLDVATRHDAVDAARDRGLLAGA